MSNCCNKANGCPVCMPDNFPATSDWETYAKKVESDLRQRIAELESGERDRVCVWGKPRNEVMSKLILSPKDNLGKILPEHDMEEHTHYIARLAWLEADKRIAELQETVDRQEQMLQKASHKIEELEQERDRVCRWKYDGSEYGDCWESECGHSWVFIEGDMKDNNVTYCQGCGGKVEVSDD